MGSDERFSAAAGSEPCNFTWFESYTNAMLKLPTRELQVKFAFGVIEYGSFGTEPFFDYPLDIVFETIRPNLDKSRKRSAAGKKGLKTREENSQ